MSKNADTNAWPLELRRLIHNEILHQSILALSIEDLSLKTSTIIRKSEGRHIWAAIIELDTNTRTSYEGYMLGGHITVGVRVEKLKAKQGCLTLLECWDAVGLFDEVVGAPTDLRVVKYSIDGA